ncbi:hypothetical protein [Bacillus sp. FJAT-29814]|uniref:hypothetical protein n=1 Tax=Bacillus sp. FJAT-29814 TaxID=1729688 RepID=UPI00082E1997|nr:hypothetical protein [Bacillus sp. FJAT-29814]
MRVLCEWIIKLPYRFGKSEDFEFHPVNIDEISLIPISLQDKNYFNGLKVQYETNMPDEIIPKDLHDYHKTLDFKLTVSKRVGHAVNIYNSSLTSFLNNFTIGNLFNGEDFTTGYIMKIYNDENIIFDGLDALNSIPVITKEDYNKLIQKVINPHPSVSHQFIKLANVFLENGYFDMALLNLAMSLESLVKKTVYSNGISSHDLVSEKGYVVKFFHLGLKLSKGYSLMEKNKELFNSIKVITDLRNHVAHGNTIKLYSDFKGWSDDMLFSYIEDLIWDGEDIIELIESLVTINETI